MSTFVILFGFFVGFWVGHYFYPRGTIKTIIYAGAAIIAWGILILITGQRSLFGIHTILTGGTFLIGYILRIILPKSRDAEVAAQREKEAKKEAQQEKLRQLEGLKHEKEDVSKLFD